VCLSLTHLFSLTLSHTHIPCVSLPHTSNPIHCIVFGEGQVRTHTLTLCLCHTHIHTHSHSVSVTHTYTPTCIYSDEEHFCKIRVFKVKSAQTHSHFLSSSYIHTYSQILSHGAFCFDRAWRRSPRTLTNSLSLSHTHTATCIYSGTGHVF